MRKWKVTYTNESGTKTFEYIDVRDILTQYVHYGRNYINLLKKAFSVNSHYIVFAGFLKKVINPKNEDFTANEMFTFVGVTKESATLSFLFGGAGGTISIFGVYPEAFAEVIEKNRKFLDYIAWSVVEYPNLWIAAALYGP